MKETDGFELGRILRLSKSKYLLLKKYNLYAILFILLYFLGGLLSIILSTIYNYNKFHIGAAFLFSSILAVYALKSLDNRICTPNIYIFPLYIHFINISFMLVSIYYYSTIDNYYIDIYYFAIVAFVGWIISIEIVYLDAQSKYQVALIFLEIFLISTIMAASFLFLFPGPIGNDSSDHVSIIRDIISYGFIEQTTKYHSYPIFHIIYATIAIILNESDLKLIQFILLIIQNAFSIFIFLIARYLFNKKIALLSTLLFVLSPYVLIPKYLYSPSSFILIYFMVFLYIIFTAGIRSSRISILQIILIIVIIFAHPLPVVLCIFLLSMLLLIPRIFNNNFTFDKIGLSSTGIFFAMILTLSQWMTAEEQNKPILQNLVKSIINSFELYDIWSVADITLAPMYSKLDVILTDLGYSFLMLLGITGAIFALGTHNIKNYRISSLSIITLIFTPIPYVLAIIYPMSLPGRWFPYISIFLSIFAGLCIYIYYYKCKFLIFILPLLIFFMITSPIVNVNSHIYSEDLSSRPALKETEIIAGDFINTKYNFSTFHANSRYIVLLIEKTLINRKIAFIDPRDPNTYEKYLTAVRKSDLEKCFILPQFGRGGKKEEIICPNNDFISYLNSANHIYNNEEVRLYIGRQSIVSNISLETS